MNRSKVRLSENVEVFDENGKAIKYKDLEELNSILAPDVKFRPIIQPIFDGDSPVPTMTITKIYLEKKKKKKKNRKKIK